jgi:hypothetical protein
MQRFQSLPFTLGADAATVRKCELFRKKRNITDYEQAGTITDYDVQQMRELASALRTALDRRLG